MSPSSRPNNWKPYNMICACGDEYQKTSPTQKGCKKCSRLRDAARKRRSRLKLKPAA